jgi:pimeloyl-ACP methyl ester carboxylesterase
MKPMELAARRWGTDDTAPLALLLHGVSGSADTWWRVAPRLVDAGWRVVALDLRGHGSSPRAGGPYTVRDLADDVAETLGDESVDVAWGHSLGALTVMDLATRKPAMARRVILEDPPSGDRRAGWAAEKREEAAAVRRDLTGFVRRLLRENPTWTDADALAAVAGIASCDTDTVTDSSDRWPSFDTARRIAAIEVPALLVMASDGVLDAPERNALRAALPAEAVVELESGHTLHRDRFEDCLRLVLDWLGR